MNWKQPPNAVFWLPMPANGQSRMDAVEWQIKPGTPRQTMELTDPTTKQPYTVEILDIWGAYDIYRVPNFLARQCTDKDRMTGEILVKLLKSQVPEFKQATKIMFYQVTTNLTHDESNQKND